MHTFADVNDSAHLFNQTVAVDGSRTPAGWMSLASPRLSGTRGLGHCLSPDLQNWQASFPAVDQIFSLFLLLLIDLIDSPRVRRKWLEREFFIS
jgi:hypothetical protein